MARGGTELFQSSTESLVSQDKFYPTRISVRHHQLRHLVSVTKGNCIYYVNDYDVFVINLETGYSTLLATVPFEARCLAADHGWVCVGGEQNGDCAFIRLASADGSPRCFEHDLSVDVLGGEIVNSMNIHMLRDDTDGDPEPVVLISNNDRSVKLFSLARREVLATLEHDAPMNYAVLSPDSTLLAAVGDSDKVYFYHRRSDEPAETKERASPFPNFDWRPFAVPCVPTGDDVLDDHGFAITFSPSGHLCAASSQGGAITVFDIAQLRERSETPEDAILCSFRSSRPTLWGCVRSMAFSPDPWDMLAWAEDHGRIGVADVRQMFVRRQIVSLTKENFETIEVRDNTPEAYRTLSVKERLKQQDRAPRGSIQPDGGHSVRTDNSVETSRTDSVQRRMRRHELMSYHRSLDLDARERSVLDALETTMDDVGHHARPFSVNYSSPPRFRPSHLADPSSGDLDVRLMASTDPRTGYRSYQPRRRTSVVLSDSVNRHLAPQESTRARISASPGRMTDDDDTPSMSTNDLTPSRGGSTSQPRTSDIPTSDPWHVIQSALESARRTDESGPVNEDRPSLAQIEAALDAERRLGTQLERQLADERYLSHQLRMQLDNQDRLLRSQQRELEAVSERDARLEPSIDRLLQRELVSEQQFGDQRTQELETEIRLGTNRARRLESVRAHLLSNTSRPASNANDQSSTSAQTTTLPTFNTLTNQQQPTTTSTNATPLTDNLAATLQRHEAFRRQRVAHIDNLERQIRLAESRVASASSDILGLESAIRRGAANATANPTANADRLVRQHEARVRAASMAANGTASADTPAPPRTPDLRSAAVANGSGNVLRGATTRQVVSELTGQTTEREMRLARMMFLQSASRQRSMDANGNWVAGGGLQRMLVQAATGGRASGAGGVGGIGDVGDVVGVGTAGIGWSVDGRSL